MGSLLFKSLVRFLCVPQITSKKKTQQLENKQLCFFSLFVIIKRSLPAFGQAYESTTPLHSVFGYTSFASTPFQPYCVCRPKFFQRLLLRTAIGVGSVRWKTLLYLKSRNVPKTDFILSRRFTFIVTTLRYVPLLYSSVYGRCTIATTPLSPPPTIKVMSFNCGFCNRAQDTKKVSKSICTMARVIVSSIQWNIFHKIRT